VKIAESNSHPRSVRLGPIIGAIGILLSALIVDGAIVVAAVRVLGKSTFTSMPWQVLYFGHAGMLLVALIWIAVLSRLHFREFGFRSPDPRKYVWIAVPFGFLFGIVMTVADYAHNFATHTPPEHFSISLTNVIGLLSFEGLYAGTVEKNPVSRFAHDIPHATHD
jgi:hypothetical protein